MGRVILAAILGGVVFFVFVMASWMALPFHKNSFATFENEDVVREALKAHIPQRGVYMIPQMCDMTDDSALERHREGPLGMLIYNPEGGEPMPPSVMATSLGMNVLSALLAGIILYLGRKGFTGYCSRVFVVTVIGLFSAVVSHGSGWVWMGVPENYTLVMSADLVVGWFLAGLVMAALIKEKKVAAE